MPHDFKNQISFPSHIHRNRVLSPSPAAKDTVHIEPKSSNTSPELGGRKERSTKIEHISHITSHQCLCLVPFYYEQLPAPTHPKYEFRWQSPCAAEKIHISNAGASLKGSEAALNAWMRLKAAANRYLEDTFLLFLKILTLSYPRRHKRKAFLA